MPSLKIVYVDGEWNLNLHGRIVLKIGV